MDWSKDITLEFLSLYEQEPVIWNPRDPDHKIRCTVNDAWRRIENQMSIECTVKDLKRKKESLMASYRAISNKIRTNKELGEEDYIPNWFAYETMAKFLNDIYRPHAVLNSSQEIENVWLADDSTELDDQEEIDIVKSEYTVDTTNRQTPKTTITPFVEKEIRKRKEISMAMIEKRIEDAPKKIKRDYETPKKDECLLYAELLATRLRALDESIRDVLMHEIDGLVFKAKMQQRNSSQYGQSVPSTSSSYDPQLL